MGKNSRRKVKSAKKQMPYVVRTFEGLPGECDWVALRELVPSASATVRVLGSDRSVRVCSLLPGASAGLVRPDGEVWLGLQVAHNFGDISRDLAYVVEQGLQTEPGNPIAMTDPGVGKRLQDLIDPASDFDVEVHEGFDYWVEETDSSEGTADIIAAANESVPPTVRLESVNAAYWTNYGERTFLRWVLPHEEAKLFNALARLRQRGDDSLAGDYRLIGTFRAHGLLVPVWEMPNSVQPAELEQPLAQFSKRLDEALADDAPLSPEERATRGGLTSRQLTIR